GWYNNFKYTYSGNQLTKVTDAGTAARTNTFSYDANGNGITNSRLGISKIEYNHLNLPSKLVKGAENLIYSYDANGRKLSKTLGSAVTDYVDGIQYENGVLKFIQTEEGRILPNGSSYIYEYFLKDHLGNTRAVVDHSGTIKQIQDYYPFGMEMNQGNALNTASNLYKYNGKEKQVELGLDQLDYGARFYDAEIGRWNVVDPLADMFENVSPYNYGMNNPILMIDPTGMGADTAQVWGIVPTIPRSGISIPLGSANPVGTRTFPRTTLRPIPPPNPFVLLFGLLLLPSNYFDPQRSKDEIPQKPFVYSEVVLKEVLKDAKKTRTTGSGIDEYEKDGGMDQANKDYDDLVVEGTSKQIPIGRVGKTVDGKTINVRSKSSPRHDAPGIPGPPSVEIYNPNTGQSEIKIRYPK
ncbi:RHS repeat-associated core domain-containing protein, partial [Sphingobacterium sp. InxBP1]|uniref:RHS repeat domain-containing protein n=1 Tax=Sphingobacterium sp. InxBP1 TaxID=2870328 RepID=UPI002244DBED